MDPTNPFPLRRRTHEILEKAHPGDHLSLGVDIALIVLIVANVLAVILESVDSLAAAHGPWLRTFETVSIGVFTVEYLLRLWSCVEFRNLDPARPWRSRLRYVFRPLALADLLAIAPFWLTLVAGPMDLRFLRALRLLRVFKLTRYSAAMGLLAAVFREEAGSFGAALFVLLVMMILASSGIYLVEHRAQPEDFGSIPAAMWWAMATLTTVGYGDVTPITPWGKFFGACITIVGIGMVALPSGLLASGFSEQLRRRREQFQHEVEEVLEHGHITPGEQRMLEELREELGFSREQAAEILQVAARQVAEGPTAFCPHCGRSLEHPAPARATPAEGGGDGRPGLS